MWRIDCQEPDKQSIPRVSFYVTYIEIRGERKTFEEALSASCMGVETHRPLRVGHKYNERL